MKPIDITKMRAQVLVISVYNHGNPYEPIADYKNHDVFDYAPSWATTFPTFISDGVLKDSDGYTFLGPDGDKHKIAYLWTSNH